MIGVRIGAKIGLRIGPAAGVGDDELGSSDRYAAISLATPGLVEFIGQSNSLVPALGSDASSFPEVLTPFSSVQIMRCGSAFANPPVFFRSGPEDAQLRTTAINVSFNIGSDPMKPMVARTLHADSSGWAIGEFGVDSIGLMDEMINPAWPVSGGTWYQRFNTEVASHVSSMGKQLKYVVIIQGEADAGESPDATNYYANLVSLVDTIRLRHGNVGIIVVRLSNNFGAGSVAQVREAEESFVRNDSRARLVRGDDLAFFDTAHYEANAACTLGQRIGAAILDLKNSELAVPSSPVYGVAAVPTIALAAVSPVTTMPTVFGTYNGKADIGVTWLAAIGNTNFAAPSGWNQVANSPQHDAGSALNARLQACTRSLSAGDTAPTWTDVAGDDAKMAGVFTVLNSSGIDATTGGTAAAGTTLTVTLPTTTVPNCLVVVLVAITAQTDATPEFSAWSAVDLTGLTEQIDVATTSGVDIGFAVATGIKASAGAPAGNLTATIDHSVTMAWIAIAFRP